MTQHRPIEGALGADRRAEVDETEYQVGEARERRVGVV